jgi:hypothetical protein
MTKDICEYTKNIIPVTIREGGLKIIYSGKNKKPVAPTGTRKREEATTRKELNGTV